MRKAIVLFMILIMIIGVGCGAKEEAYESAPAEMATEYAEPEGFGNDEVKHGGIQTNRKVIQSAYIVMETLAFDPSVKAVKDMTYEYKGYFETMQVDGKRMDLADHEQYRNARFVIRIPKEKYEYFLNAFEKLGNLVVNELNSEDVTDVYVDTEARVKSLKIQEERLLNILSEATKIEDIITLEERLSNIRYDIESYSGSIRKWDNLVEFTTIELAIREVQEVTVPAPETTVSRATESFTDSTEAVVDIVKALVVFIFGFIPFLVILVPIGLLVRYFMKKRNRHVKIPKGFPVNPNKDKKKE